MPSMLTMSAPVPLARSRASWALKFSSSTPRPVNETVTSRPSSAILCSNSGMT
jgi:hypothetical protein